jgi:hypothetical protein
MKNLNMNSNNWLVQRLAVDSGFLCGLQNCRFVSTQVNSVKKLHPWW